MNPIKKAAAMASLIAIIIGALRLLTCLPHIPESGFNMKACVLPIIPQIAIPNFPLIILLAVFFIGLLAWSKINDGGF